VPFSVDARGITTAFGYDVAGRRVAVTNAWGALGALTNLFAYDENGNQVRATDSLGRTTTNVFDALNRQTQVLYPDLTKMQTGYDSAGRRVAETNQEGIVTLLGYDGAGRLTAVTNALGKPEQMLTQYQYDEAGDQTAQIDALGRATTFEYDGLGRRTKCTLPGTQWESFAYDLGGNLARRVNFNGVGLTNQYDALNRLTNRASSNGYVVRWSYTATGQRQTMNDPSGSTS
jgi:YD repeat-containing protein